MALRVHSSKVEGVYKDNLPWVAGVDVEVKKTKRDISKKRVTGVKVEEKKEKDKYEDRQARRLTAAVPGNNARNACWHFLTSTLGDVIV